MSPADRPGEAEHMQGFFSLTTAVNLREKLVHELGRLKAEPLSPYAAFNFFVTAEHLVDWLCPYDHLERSRLRSKPLLALCSHLANGAKHFKLDSPRHKSVVSTQEHGDYFPAGYFPAGWFPPWYFPEARLVVNLSGEAAAELGPSIGVVDLADKVMEYWANQVLPS